ncbi:NADP-dependent aryl-alcohol dehydrogenase [Catellatospora sp. TT07R-123]|uniref:aldo/keto reductase n=1 Tax=Catellatospora sp. TT07R-123 TaxID=2733863 RepID=UPI001B265511|nr:aldo/keto reductase [Catellatospora sp. TT07R-123]GHJ47518.1 NADP-dependent aryl-alcohol dehydrogenase [Catellatospora sp. TT07R-123]
MIRLGNSDLKVFPLALGGNVFGWTADERASFAVLDAYAEAGGNFVDTADQYSEWVPGNSGGESEEIIGRWLAARGNRDQVVIATKVGRYSKAKGLAPDNIRASAETSLRRLGTDRIDLYYAHADDPDTPLAETLAAFGELVQAGKVRYVAASNYTAPRLAEALRIADAEGLPRFVALQPHYNLMHRAEFEQDLAALCLAQDVSVVPYYALASGFLTGKYRPGGAAVDSPRASGAAAHLADGRGTRVLAALDEVAAAHGVSVAAVALAWLAAQPAVAAPLASARSADQVAPLLESTRVRLTETDLDLLDTASR